MADQTDLNRTEHRHNVENLVKTCRQIRDNGLESGSTVIIPLNLYTRLCRVLEELVEVKTF